MKIKIGLIALMISVILIALNMYHQDEEPLTEVKANSIGERLLIDNYIHSLEIINDEYLEYTALKDNPYLLTFAIKKHYDNYVDLILSKERKFNYGYSNFSYYYEAINSNNYKAFISLLQCLDKNKEYINYLYYDFYSKIIYNKKATLDKEFIKFILTNNDYLYDYDYNYIFESLLIKGDYQLINEFKPQFLNKVNVMSLYSISALIQNYPQLFEEFMTNIKILNKPNIFKLQNKEILKVILEFKKYELLKPYLNYINDKELNSYLLNYAKTKKDDDLLKIIKSLNLKFVKSDIIIYKLN